MPDTKVRAEWKSSLHKMNCFHCKKEFQQFGRVILGNSGRRGFCIECLAAFERGKRDNDPVYLHLFEKPEYARIFRNSKHREAKAVHDAIVKAKKLDRLGLLDVVNELKFHIAPEGADKSIYQRNFEKKIDEERERLLRKGC